MDGFAAPVGIMKVPEMPEYQSSHCRENEDRFLRIDTPTWEKANVIGYFQRSVLLDSQLKAFLGCCP